MRRRGIGAIIVGGLPIGGSGEVGLVTQSIRPYEKGEIRLQKPILGEDVWASVADEEIKIGERVRVLEVEGNTLKVSKA